MSALMGRKFFLNGLNVGMKNENGGRKDRGQKSDVRGRKDRSQKSEVRGQSADYVDCQDLGI